MYVRVFQWTIFPGMLKCADLSGRCKRNSDKGKVPADLSLQTYSVQVTIFILHVERGRKL